MSAAPSSSSPLPPPVQADLEHSTLSNALTTPTVSSLHDHVAHPVSVVISDPTSFAAKVAKLLADGKENLQIIADFDRTISAFITSTGAMCAASHQLLESCVGFNNEEFQPKMDALNNHYFALEISHEISEEQRAAYMLEWWHKAHDLLLEQHIFHQDIEDAVRRAREQGVLELRKGAREFLHLLQTERIPCLIFSAGVKATIEATLQQEQLLLDNVSLIGNEMVFEEGSGRLLSFSEDTITSSNKNYSHVHCQAPHYHEQSCHRKNLILLGDNIGDAGMSRGFENEEVVLKIGLLHDNVEARLEQFKEKFDVVLLNDADCSFAHKLVKDICEGKKEGAETTTQANGTQA